MPTYEYQCKSCGHRFDLYHKVSDPQPAECPECKAGPVRKVFSSVGIVFKGSGFHVNDYRKQEPKSDTAPADGKTGETKADAAKPDGDSAASGKGSEGASGSDAGKPASDKSGGKSEPAAAPAASVGKPASGGSADKAA